MHDGISLKHFKKIEHKLLMKYAFNKYYILLSDSYYYYCYALSILSLIAYDLKVQVKDTMK